MVKNNHPLNTLTSFEISEAVAILKESNNSHENSSFSYISLEEPDKKALKENSDTERIVKIVGVDEKSCGFEAEINLSKKELLKEAKVSNKAGPTYTLAEIFKAIELTMENEDYQKALKKRGWTFVGPTICYSFMQSMGLVNDHVDACFRKEIVADLRQKFRRP